VLQRVSILLPHVVRVGHRQTAFGNKCQEIAAPCVTQRLQSTHHRLSKRLLACSCTALDARNPLGAPIHIDPELAAPVASIFSQVNAHSTPLDEGIELHRSLLNALLLSAMTVWQIDRYCQA